MLVPYSSTLEGRGKVRVNMVYRITYNVYRLNTVASRKLFQEFSSLKGKDSP